MPLRILPYWLENASQNMAFDEALSRIRATELVGDTLRIWKNKKAIVLGRFRRAEDDVNIEKAREHGFPIIRRFTGGGTVYHDEDCLNYSLAVKFDVQNPIDYLYRDLLKGTLLALKKLGLKAYLANKNDVAVGMRKVSGTAASIKWGVLFLHGSILLDANLRLLYSLLKIPLRVPKGIDPIKYRVANIKSFKDVEMDELADAIIWGYSKVLSKAPHFDKPLKEELKVTELLAKEKYSKREWNLSFPPKIDETKIEERIAEILTVKETPPSR